VFDIRSAKDGAMDRRDRGHEFHDLSPAAKVVYEDRRVQQTLDHAGAIP